MDWEYTYGPESRGLLVDVTEAYLRGCDETLSVEPGRVTDLLGRRSRLELVRLWFWVWGFGAASRGGPTSEREKFLAARGNRCSG